jgi:type II secretory pathway predicted ATPase ExeA
VRCQGRVAPLLFHLLAQLHQQPAQNVHANQRVAIVNDLGTPKIVLARLLDDESLPGFQQQRTEGVPVVG